MLVVTDRCCVYSCLRIKGVLLRSVQCHVIMCKEKEGNIFVWNIMFFCLKRETGITLFEPFIALKSVKGNSSKH